MNKRIWSLIVLALLSLTVLTACGDVVTWIDADGTVLETAALAKDEPLPERALPEDSDEWHYVKWNEIITENGVTYIAERVPMRNLVWKDVDGTVIKTATLRPDQEVPLVGLPNDTNEWQYIRWNEQTEGNTVIYTAERVAKLQVVWLDADGKEIARENVVANAALPEKNLPSNTAKWVYSSWSKTQSGNNVTFTAQAVPAKTVVWKDADGKELAKDFIPVSAQIPQRALPTNSPKWDYTEWVETVTGTSNPIYTYTAKGEPKVSYFAGNVFQVASADLAGNPIMLGSGFVLNKDGWFITNYHVLDGAMTAKAIFEIRNSKTGDSYTTLDIVNISYSDPKKDIIIGKLENYKSIASHYQNIPLQTRYSVGEVTYSVGYPNGVVKAELHKGKVLESLSTLAEKLYNGITYISSDSYINHGSSGGILLNEKLEVIGMTSRVLVEDGKFVLGAAIEAYNYRVLVQNFAKDNALKDMTVVTFPEGSKYIQLYRSLKNRSDAKLITDDTGTYYLIAEEWETNVQKGEDYSFSAEYRFYDTGAIIATQTGLWTNGDSMAQVLYGNYFVEGGLEGFSYTFGYDWPSGRGYLLTSPSVNYSSNLRLTLRVYQYGGVGGYVPSDANIEYAKERFNELYKEIQDLLDKA